MMPEPTPGQKSIYSLIKTVTTREELIDLLRYASDFEHELACTYLFAMHSLKNDPGEGELTDTQAEMVRGWRIKLSAEAMSRMGHLAQLSNLLIAIGGTPQITRPTFPLLTANASSARALRLAPFSQATIERLLAYEPPATAELTADQPIGEEVGQDLSDDHKQRAFPGDYRAVRSCPTSSPMG